MKNDNTNEQPRETGFSHLGKEGEARMVDVSAKPRVRRTARAVGRVYMKQETLALIRQNQIAKGDVLSTARIAGIMGGKEASRFIPLCHPIEIDQVTVDLTLEEEGVFLQSFAVCTDRTGIEMEALSAVSIACLTIYDMCKAVDKEMEIGGIKLIEKTKEHVS